MRDELGNPGSERDGRADEGISRRQFLGGVGRAAILVPLATGGLGVFLSACGSAAPSRPRGAAKHLTFTTGKGLIDSFIDQYVAADLGFWTRRGLDVRIVSGIGTSDDVQEVVSGVSDFTTGGFPTIPEIVNHDLSLVNVVGDFQRAIFVISSYTPHAITSVAQLRGKTVGIITVGGAEVIELDILLHQAGIPTSEVSTPVVGLGPGVYELAVQGKIDAWMGVDSVNASLIAAGQKITDYRPPSLAGNLGKCAQGYMTGSDLIKQDPAAVQAYVEGTIEAMEFCTKRSNWRRAAAAWHKYEPTATYASLAPAMPTLIRDWTDDGRARVGAIHLDAYQQTIDLMYSAGMIKKRVSADTIATTEFVDRAYKSLGI